MRIGQEGDSEFKAEEKTKRMGRAKYYNDPSQPDYQYHSGTTSQGAAIERYSSVWDVNNWRILPLVQRRSFQR